MVGHRHRAHHGRGVARALSVQIVSQAPASASQRLKPAAVQVASVVQVGMQVPLPDEHVRPPPNAAHSVALAQVVVQ